ncbi:MAG: PQQ-binding-like beta-propeller repeat protein [Acidobacteriia bacterium]|nr:PQQ-binding-like beta-propeller repeat protein [Terriglobia bacterium]
MTRRFVWIAAAAGFVFAIAGFSQSKNQTPAQPTTRARTQPELANPVPFRSADGRITGWKVTIPGNRPLASPAIAEGKVFVGGGFGSHEFYAFDAATGKRIWTYQTADDGPTAAAVSDGVIAFNTESCELEVITTAGRPLWKKWLGDPLMSMPAIADGVVYMAYPNSRGDGKYYLAAFDLKTGAERWKYPMAGEIITAPVIERDRVYFATVNGSVVSLNRRDGAKVWQEDANATSAPAVWNERSYFSRRQQTTLSQAGKPVVQQTELVASRAIAAPQSGLQDLRATRQNADYLDYAKRKQSASERKSQAYDASVGFGGAAKGSAVMAPAQANIGQASVHGIWAYQGSKSFVDNGRLFSSMGNNAQSVDPNTGKVNWTRALRKGTDTAVDAVLTPPAIVNGKVFVGASSGEVYVLSAQTGDVLWKVDIGEPISFQPAIAGGRVYVAANQGTLVCLNTNDPHDDGWLMWGATAAHNGRPR